MSGKNITIGWLICGTVAIKRFKDGIISQEEKWVSGGCRREETSPLLF